MKWKILMLVSCEYGFTSQLDAGTSQALGPALLEEVNTNMKEVEPEEERPAGNQADEASLMDSDDVNTENKPTLQSKLSIRNSVTGPIQEPDTDKTHRENSPTQNFEVGNSKMDSMDKEEDPDARSKAVNLWRRCELLTSKPSQEKIMTPETYCNPLQQLVLIIGDELKRTVGKFLQRKRMVLYLLPDDAEQSFMDVLVCNILPIYELCTESKLVSCHEA
ncbi:unnamed protein product [Cochlearia groenlandica]